MTANENPDQTNHALWQGNAKAHRDTPMYQGYIAQLKEKGSCLNSIERELLGDISGHNVLHLQCHIGPDTLSLAKMGGRVTGVDFSDEAIAQARALSRELAIPADFVHASVTDPNLNLGKDFDLVFTSYGTITWYRDLEAWADTIARHLKPGGRLVMVDGHPMPLTISEVVWEKEGRLEIAYPYFATGQPTRWESDESYAGGGKLPTRVSYDWPHPISEILGVLLRRKIAIEHFDEHVECVWKMLPGMEQDADGYYRLPEKLRHLVPMLYSIVGRMG